MLEARPTGLEPVTGGLEIPNIADETTGIQPTCGDPQSNVAFCVALLEADFPELARVIAGWPRLSEEARQAVAALVAAAGAGADSSDFMRADSRQSIGRQPGWVEA
jgi:hypothetical protein